MTHQELVPAPILEDPDHTALEDPWPYHPIHPAEGVQKQIRLLDVAPGSYDDPIQISLSTHYIDELPNYEALSYVWGDEMSENPARVNEYPLSITENLDIALRHLRTKDDNRIMWIDALCIDQQDVVERNSQVQLMSTIYSKAQRVVIWLGPAYEESDSVMDCISKPKVDASDEPKFMASAMCLFLRPWFSRVWVLQEVVLASAAVIQCGCRIQSLSTFFEALDRVREKWAHLEYEYDISKVPEGEGSLERIRTFLINHSTDVKRLEDLIRDSQIRTMSFPRAYNATHYRKATDPRDKVYGLLGMCQTTEGPNTLVADYSKSTADVFSEAMSVILSTDFYCGYPRIPMRLPWRDAIPGLPSWVPDMGMSKPFLGQRYDLSKYQPCRPYDPSPLRPGEDTWEAAMNLTYLHQETDFSSDHMTLYAEGVPLGSVIAHCELQVTPGDDKSMEDYREEFMALIRNFFTGRNVPNETILKALIGPINQFQRRIPINVDSALHCFDQIVDTRNPSLFGEIVSSEVEVLWAAFALYAQGRTLFLTDTGRVGVSIGQLRDGDLLVGMFGRMYLMLLRRGEGDTHSMVNIAHVADCKIGDDCDCQHQGEEVEKDKIWPCGHRKYVIV